MYTKDQLRNTLETLQILKADNPEKETDKYTVDDIVDHLIVYFQACQIVLDEPLTTEEAYERAMGVISK